MLLGGGPLAEIFRHDEANNNNEINLSNRENGSNVNVARSVARGIRHGTGTSRGENVM